MNQKNQKGITLIALVITIIVLLILAGVSINMVLGDDGIIKNAQAAKKANKKANIEEAIKLLALEKKAAQHMGDNDTVYPEDAEGVRVYLAEKKVIDNANELSIENDYLLKDEEGTEYSLKGIVPWGTTELLKHENGVLAWVGEKPTEELGDIYIPEGTTTIPECFFEYVSVNDIYIPDSVTTIELAGLAVDNANNIYIPNSVTSIGDYAFSAANINSIYIPSSVTSMGYYVFQYSKIRSLTIGAGVPLQERMFYLCQGIDSLTIEEGITIIPTDCFEVSYGIREIKIPNSVTTIDQEAFECCYDLSRVELGSGVTNIGISAFVGCPITTINFPSNLKTIGFNSFFQTKLKNVTLPNGLTTIGAEAFRGCTELESITIPSSVTSIGNNAFNGSTGKIYIYNGNTYNKFNVTEEIANAWGTTLENIEFMPDVMPETVVDLKIGDCVTYIDGNGQEHMSFVISEGANPEIAVLTGKTVTIGGNDFDTVVELYNKAYQEINAAANSYINPKLAKSARAFNTTGATNPDTKDLEIPNHGTVTFTDYSSYYNWEVYDYVNCWERFPNPFLDWIYGEHFEYLEVGADDSYYYLNANRCGPSGEGGGVWCFAQGYNRY